MFEEGLSKNEQLRYMRHFMLDEVGESGQLLLKKSRVLCVGAGGLGNPLLLYLAAAGVGTLGVMDDDVVEVNNLQRQILFSTKDLSAKKVDVAVAKLKKLNPFVSVNPYFERLTEENARQVLEGYDIAVDCTDNFPTRYLLNDACFHAKKPNVFASISKFEGQCTVFCTEGGPCYRCLYPAPPPEGLMPDCAQGGVLGVLPGLLGVIQAVEVIKYLLGMGERLVGRLLTVDALNMRFKEFEIKQAKDCPLCVKQTPFNQLERTQMRCQMMQNEANEMRELSVREFKKIKAEDDCFLLDVREPFEYEICHLNGYLIPLGQLPERLGELDKHKHIVVHCKAGVRGESAAKILKEAGFENVSNLKGGILAWIDEVDPTLTRY